VPGSTWAFLDAVGSRRASEAAMLAERLIADGAPLQLLVAQLHRRLRELIMIREHVAAGSKAAQVVQDMRLAPYRAQKLTEQARNWQPAELDTALDGLLDLDLLAKGISRDGAPRSTSEDQSRLYFFAWLSTALSR
jgi:DNA polymerase III delta subunit